MSRFKFRGEAGEIVSNFLCPGTFSYFPMILVYWMIFFFLTGYISNVNELIAAIILYLAAGFLLSRYCLSAKNGKINDGFFSDEFTTAESLNFVWRYTFALILWLIPLVIMFIFIKRSDAQPELVYGGLLSGSSIFSTGAIGILVVFSQVLLILAPIVSCLIALMTESWVDVFKSATWGELIEHSSDIATLAVLLLGTGICFFCLYVLPLAFVAYVGFKISFRAGMILSSAPFAVPMMLMPVLLGKLCGMLVFCQNHVESTKRDDKGKSANAELKQEISYFKTCVSRLSGEEDLQASIEKREKALKINPYNVPMLIEMILLKLKLKEQDEALQIFIRLMPLLINNGHNQDALDLYKLMGCPNDKLTLDRNIFQSFITILLSNKLYKEAGLIVLNQSKGIFDEVGIQKKIFAIAEQAGRESDGGSAIFLYQLLLEKFPQSTLKEFVVARLTAETQKKKPTV